MDVYVGTFVDGHTVNNGTAVNLRKEQYDYWTDWLRKRYE